MKHYPRLLLFICVFLMDCHYLCAQFPGFYVQHFNSENGVPNTIKGIEQDRNGYVWLATEAGLVRFDGRRFHLYDRSEAGAPVTRLYDVGISDDGRIFTRVQYGGLHYVTPANTLKSISAEELFGHNIPTASTVNHAQKLQSNFNQKSKAGLIGDSARPAWGNSSRAYFGSVVQTGDTYYYVNRHNQVMMMDTSQQKFARVSFTGSGLIWNKLKFSDSLPISLINHKNKIFLRKADTLYRLEFSRNKTSAVATPALFIGGIHNIVGVLQLADSTTTIVTTSTDGIYVFKKQAFNTVTLNERNSNVFYAQAAFGTDGVITSKGVLTPRGFIPFRNNFFGYSILKTSNNTYYLNRRDLDTFSLCQVNDRLETITEIPLESGGVNCMRQLKDGAIWISASMKFLGHVKEGYVQWYERPADLPEQFLINTFIEANTGEFWIGGRLGLAKVNPASQHVQLIPELTNTYVRSIYSDPSGVLWVGTYGNGFYALHNNRVIAIPPDLNGYLKYVHAFLPDSSGRLWISTNHGLFLFSLKELYSYIHTGKQAPYYSYFDNTDGFLTNEFNGGCSPAAIVLGNGKFSLPSLNGLVQFFPDRIQPVMPASGIFVDKIIADTSAIPLTGAIDIGRGITRLQFHVSSPYFGNSYNQHIEYRIDGDDTWYRLNDDNVIEVTNMRKGEHTIELRKRTGFGETSFVTKDIPFVIRPAFYETDPFRIAVLAATLLLLYLAYRLRIKYLLRQKKWLQAEVYKKTKEQNALIDNLEMIVAELEQSRDDLRKTVQFKETLAMIITHDLQSPLRFLSSAMDRMHEKTREENPAMLDLSDELRKTSANIHRFVEDFGLWIKKVNMSGNMHNEPVNIYDLLNEMHIFFGQLQKTRNNTLVLETSPEIFVCSDYQLLKIILRNIIDNANKHTQGGAIHVKLTTENENAIIKVSDTGSGMKPEMLQRIRRYTQQQSSFKYGNETDGVGFGYRFVTDFCRMLNIQIHIESAYGHGTTVTFSNLNICQPPVNTAKSTSKTITHAN